MKKHLIRPISECGVHTQETIAVNLAIILKEGKFTSPPFEKDDKVSTYITAKKHKDGIYILKQYKWNHQGIDGEDVSPKKEYIVSYDEADIQPILDEMAKKELAKKEAEKRIEESSKAFAKKYNIKPEKVA